MGGDGGKDGKLGLHAGELLRLALQVDDLLRVGEVGQQVALDAEGDGSGGGDGDLVQQVGVRLVAQAVGAGTDRGPGVEVLVCQTAGGGEGMGEHLAHGVDGVVQRIDIVLFGSVLWGRATPSRRVGQPWAG